MINAMVRPKKRLFLALILVSLLLAAMSTYGLWVVSFPGLANISAYLPVLLGWALAFFLLVLAVGIGGVILTIAGFPTLTMFQAPAWSAVNLLFPLAIRIGRLLDVDKERIERSFIEASNHLVKNRGIHVPPERLLILTPHCLQHESCPHKITHDVSNCKNCGRCQVGELLEIARRHGCHLAVVTGGTLARKVIKGLRPKAVLAIACERDLTSGIQDVFPLPVIGVLNERPFGPCCNTRIDVDKVDEAVREFVVK
ncbi:DUF116 domain-containing protein [Azotosporobacter soli]|uniref:DUF116 domain-containing protein n=1 Tax=Azotosporobacter soli TaxID=3055040 RepID=UPI0031FED909